MWSKQLLKNNLEKSRARCRADEEPILELLFCKSSFGEEVHTSTTEAFFYLHTAKSRCSPYYPTSLSMLGSFSLLPKWNLRITRDTSVPLAPPESSAMASNFLVKGYKIHEGSNANTNQDGPLGHLQVTVDWLMWMFPKIEVFPPKSSHFKRASIINHPFWGSPIFGNTHNVMKMWCVNSCGINHFPKSEDWTIWTIVPPSTRISPHSLREDAGTRPFLRDTPPKALQSKR